MVITQQQDVPKDGIREPGQSRLFPAVCIVLIVGLSLGLGLGLPPPNDGVPWPWTRVCTVAGWLYFTSWSLSFLPQATLNYQRKSVVGLSLDFAVINVLGFAAYSIFNLSFLYDHRVQAQYREAHHGTDSAVKGNDVFFALFALLVTGYTLIQCAIYKRGTQRVSMACIVGTGSTIAITIIYGVLVAFGAWGLTYLQWLYWLSYVKMGVTLVKYMPQVRTNYLRKSTDGWNIQQTVLDLIGGLASMAQLGLEAAVKRDWEVLTGDPAKLALGLFSVAFDLIMGYQHYVLYAGNKAPASERPPYIMVHHLQPPHDEQPLARRPPQLGPEEAAPLLSPSAMSASSTQDTSTAPSVPVRASIDVEQAGRT